MVTRFELRLVIADPLMSTVELNRIAFRFWRLGWVVRLSFVARILA